jgi:hypothetical protein
VAIRSLILTIGAKDESLSKTLEKIGALGAKTKDDLANLGSDVNTKAAEKQIDDLAAAIKKSQTNTENLATAARQTSTGIELVGRRLAADEDRARSGQQDTPDRPGRLPSTRAGSA